MPAPASSVQSNSTLRSLPWLAAVAVAVTVLCGLGFAMVRGFAQPAAPAGSETPLPAAAAPPERVVYLGGKLSDEELICFTSGINAAGRSSVFLLDTHHATPYHKAFLDSFHPERIIPVGSFAGGIAQVEKRLRVRLAPPLPAARDLFKRAERVVVCPARPRSTLLQAACLAGVMRAPLLIADDKPDAKATLCRQLVDWRTLEVHAVGDAIRLCRGLTGVSLFRLPHEESVVAAYVRRLRRAGPIETLVVANPADSGAGLGGVSALAPMLALQRHAVLLCTKDSGTNTAAVVAAALQNPALARVESVLLAAGLKAIPMEQRANPVPGKDAYIEMEPLTPAGHEPFSFAVGRLFHDDLSVLPLLLARQQQLAALAKRAGPPRRALIVSNPGGGLSLLETFSRNTTKELQNCGYETTALFDDEVTREQVQQLLPSQDIFLWEGHYRTMVDRYEMPKWTEPLQPGLIFLQSCLALNEKEAQPLLRRGALGVIGSSTRMYSASGGAFTLAFFNAMNYDNQSLGGSLRQAKNFLLQYVLLKEKLLEDKAKLGGANIRSAWAFTLWGDPTLKLPRPPAPPDSLTPVRHKVHGNTLVLTLPEAVYDGVKKKGYQAQNWPNARMAGLLRREIGEDDRFLVPFLFAEVHLPKARPGVTPRLTSKVPAKHWVFSWDERRRCGYLLVAPRPRDEKEVRFHIDYDG
jgi:Peptidase family C25